MDRKLSPEQLIEKIHAMREQYERLHERYDSMVGAHLKLKAESNRLMRLCQDVVAQFENPLGGKIPLSDAIVKLRNEINQRQESRVEE